MNRNTITHRTQNLSGEPNWEKLLLLVLNQLINLIYYIESASSLMLHAILINSLQDLPNTWQIRLARKLIFPSASKLLFPRANLPLKNRNFSNFLAQFPRELLYLLLKLCRNFSFLTPIFSFTLFLPYS